jgi:hypothetical protein
MKIANGLGAGEGRKEAREWRTRGWGWRRKQQHLKWGKQLFRQRGQDEAF